MGIPLGFLCATVCLPKSLCIHNTHLGVLQRILQLGVVLAVSLNIFWAGAWNSETIPVAYGIELWGAPGSDEAVYNTAVRHCNDTASMVYTYSNAAGSVYKPTSCRPAPAAEAYKKNGVDMFFPTYFKEETYVTERPGKCDTVTCAATETKTYRSYPNHCECTRTSSFFVQNAEENVLFLNHGFQVETLSPMGDRGLAKSRSVLTHEDYDIMTIITKKGDGRLQDRPKCKIGGRSAWPQNIAKTGITGPLKDWLACAETNLDDLAEDSKSGLPGETTAPPIRIIGLSIQINLFYTTDLGKDEDHEGPVCYVEVIALPLWNSFNAMDYTLLPTAIDDTRSFRYRYGMGISVSVQARGSFKFFDYNALLLVITSSVVLLSVPGTIMGFIAMYAVGRLSKVYSALAVENFAIVDRFHCVCARLLGYKSSFNMLTNGTMMLSADDLDANLQDVLKSEIDSGVLNKEEIDKLSKFMYGEMDAGGDGHIALGEYLRACNNNEAVKISDLTTFFDGDAKQSMLECLLSDLNSKIAVKVQPQSKSDSTQVTPISDIS